MTLWTAMPIPIPLLCKILIMSIKEKYVKLLSLINEKSKAFEPRHEKTGFLPLRKRRRRSAVQ